MHSRLIPLLFALTLCAAAPAQGQKAKTTPSAPTVKVSLTQAGVRLSALGAISRVRVEVLASDGSQVFNSRFRPGSFYDWAGRDSQGQPLPDGTYQIAFTTADAAGHLGLNQCAVTVAGGSLALDLGEAEPAGAAEREARQDSQPAESSKADDAPAMTLTAHDGRVGEVVSTSGALSFRLGDFFSGKDREAMRLSEKGLTLRGSLTAEGGIRFSDGTVLTSTGSAARLSADGTVTPAASGVGTQGQLAKWADNAGTLADSAVAESDSGNLGVGKAPDPLFRLDVSSPSGTIPFRFTQQAPASATPALAQFYTSDGLIGQYAATAGAGVNFVTGAGPGRNFGLFANNSFLSPQLFITSAGNVGVGTQSPTAKLDVRGDVTLDSGDGAGPVLFTGTAGAEQNRYLNIINSPAFRSASGLKAGGLLVSDSYGYANPGKNDLVVKGNVGVGTSAPAVAGLHIGAGVTGGQAQLRLDNANGMTGGLNRWANRTELTSSDAIGLSAGGVSQPHFWLQTNGNIGVGTFSPSFKLDVVGPIRTSGTDANDLIAETRSGTNSWARAVVRTPEQEWAWGTSRNYNGNQIYLSDDTYGQARMTVQPAGGAIAFPVGNVGVGVNSPTARLHVASGDTFSVFAEGNVGQAGGKFGLPKAMLEISRSSGAVVRCYSAVSGLTSGTCGINVSVSQGLFFYIRFPFRVTDRFFSLAMQNETDSAAQLAMRGFDANDISGQTAIVYYFSGVASAQSFHLIVY